MKIVQCRPTHDKKIKIDICDKSGIGQILETSPAIRRISINQLVSQSISQIYL